MLCKSMGVNQNIINNCTNRNHSLYAVSCELHVTEGVILWCQHNGEQNTVVLSDYDPGTGVLALLTYAHVHLYFHR